MTSGSIAVAISPFLGSELAAMGSPVAIHHLVVPQSAVQRKRLLDGEVEEAFKAWYAVYPRHTAPRAAFKAYRQAINRGHPPFELQKGARRYAVEVADTQKKYVKHPATWLNGDCWMSDPEPQRQLPTPIAMGTIHSVRGILERGSFQGRGSDFTRHFIAYLLDAAAPLRLTHDRAALARSLAALYLWIEDERRQRNFEVQDYEMLMSDSALLHQYIGWVGEQGWHTASLNVLQFDSPAFGQFRREAALMDQFGRDPITKHSRFSSL